MTPAPAGLHPGWRYQRAWQHLQTDFGEGLGFLNTWALWRQDQARPDLLHVVGLLNAAPQSQDLLKATEQPAFRPWAAELVQQCQGLLPGVHRLSFEAGQVLLTLCVGQPLAMLREQELQFDSVELDTAHTPAKGWTQAQLQQLARCCKRGTRLMVNMQPAAEHLERNAWADKLQACGFRTVPDAQETPALVAEFAPAWQPRTRHVSRSHRPQQPAPNAGRCTVIGAGLAGAACAASLARRG